jgi:hypothetical protein
MGNEPPSGFEPETSSLPWKHSTAELRGHSVVRFGFNPNPLSSIRSVPGEGFEPSKAMPADLQSAPFGRSGIPAETQLGRR